MAALRCRQWLLLLQKHAVFGKWLGLLELCRYLCEESQFAHGLQCGGGRPLWLPWVGFRKEWESGEESCVKLKCGDAPNWLPLARGTKKDDVCRKRWC
jgi:hypothetical protein